MRRKEEDYNKYYETQEELGRTPLCIIYSAVNKQTKENKALKIMEKKTIEEFLKSQGIVVPTKKDIELYFNHFEIEAKNMEILQGKNKKNINAVFIDEVFSTKNEFAIVMEKCDNNIWRHMAYRKEPFNSGEIYEILKQLNNSFKIMVKNNIIHRALKPQNILLKYLNKEKSKFLIKLKITDDSCSLNESSHSLSTTKDRNILRITSPEILKEENSEEKSDLWSIGVLIYLFYFNSFPFRGKNEKELLENINSVVDEGNLKKINDHDLDELMTKLLTIDPIERINWEDYFNHSFFLDNPRSDYNNFYKLKRQLSSSGFGCVYEAIKKDTGEERAIKKILKSNYNTIASNIGDESYNNFIGEIKNEIDYMAIAEGINKDNQNTVKLYEYFETRDEFAIIMELCDASLANILKEKKNKKEKFDIKEILEILLQLNNTFKILIKNKVAHRDLKLENILLKKNEKGQNIWKLIDYGVSKQLTTLSLKYKTGVGTFGYMAPEILDNKEYDNKCDLWSLGIIIYYLYFQELPYNGNTPIALYNGIKNLGKNACIK